MMGKPIDAHICPNHRYFTQADLKFNAEIA